MPIFEHNILQQIKTYSQNAPCLVHQSDHFCHIISQQCKHMLHFFAQNTFMKKSKFQAKNLVFLWFPTITLILFLITFFLVTSKNNWIQSLDSGTALLFASGRKSFWNYFFVIVSYLGETQTILTLCLFLLLLPNKKNLGIPVTTSTFASLAISFFFKQVVKRDRPQGLFLGQDVLGYKFPAGYSFPSGHAQTAVVFFLLTAILFCLDKSTNFQIVILTITTAFCALLCFARIYLGVHFFSDVFAGLMLALSIVSLSLSVILNGQKKNVYQ